MQILRGNELPKESLTPDVFPTGWYVLEEGGTRSGPFQNAEDAEEASKTPGMRLERLNKFLTEK